MPEKESFNGLDVEDSINLPSVTLKVKKSGLSNLQSQEPAGQRQQRAHSKPSECLDVEDSIDPPSVTSTVKKSGLSNLQPQELAGQRQQRAHSKPSECLDVEGSINLPSVTSTVKKSGRSNPQTQNPAGQRQQRACSKSSECLDVKDSFKLSSRSLKVKGNGSGDSLPQETPTIQKQEVHTKDAEVFIPQDGTESSLFVPKTERSGCDNSLQHCSTASNKLIEALIREFLSQGKDILYISRGPITRSRTKGQTKEIPVFESSVRIFEPYAQKRQNLADRIRKVMIKELSREDSMDGLIYIYWIPGNHEIPEGLVKIGVTSVTVASRLWRKCHPDLIHKYPTESIKFPHAYRVERLIHEELRSSQHKQIVCLRCGVNSHVELFAVPLAQAIEVTKRWTEWARGQSYDKNGLIRTECIPRIAQPTSEHGSIFCVLA